MKAVDKIEDTTKTTRGTDIVLHIAEDSEEFLEEQRIDGLLSKYCKFLPVEIKFGTRKEFAKKIELTYPQLTHLHDKKRKNPSCQGWKPDDGSAL